MNKWIMIAVLFGAGLTQEANAETKPVRFLNGTVHVNRSWILKKDDGTFDVKNDVVCDTKIKIPYFEDAMPTDIKPDTIKVADCVTETHTKKPVQIAIYGLVGVGESKRPDGTVQRELSFSGSYAVVKSPNKNFTGSFAAFSTRETNLSSGTLFLPAQYKNYEKAEDVYEDTSYSANLSYEK